ncbi:MAG: hypothetical protein ABI315_06655 [Bacteroidia bacterium]
MFLKKLQINLLFFCFSLFCFSKLVAQSNSKYIDPREAKEHFSHHNYLAAIPVYKQLLSNQPDNAEYNHKLGICYLKTNINKTLAIPFLEKASHQSKFDKEVWNDLGLAYQYASRFDDAIKAYNQYKNSGISSKEIVLLNHRIETCNNGKEYAKYPINVTFENLGIDVNSPYPDYYPFTTEDESFIIFTSRRSDNIGGQLEVDGYYSSDIYISTPINGSWGKPKNLGGGINTRYDEQAVGLTPNGETMLLYLDHIDSLGNLYSSTYKSNVFQRIKKLNDNVNAYFETSGSINKEDNIIFFASKRPGGFGETDIYMSRKLPNGLWGVALNLGATINTEYREDFPTIAPDGKTLYFSSQGHAGMGDFDLFKSTWNEEDNTWSVPKNLGYPINSVGDDRCISFTKDNSVAYISAVRDGGYGDLDLYRLKFNDVEDQYTVVETYITAKDSIKNLSAIVTVTNIKDKNIQPYTYIPNTNSGKFIMALKPGKYDITVDAKGYKPYSDSITIFDIGYLQNDTKKTFILQKQ